jgi:23S rRNA-/tRNA-specific pseudouridylate synthase
MGLIIHNPLPLWKRLYDTSIFSLIFVVMFFLIHTRKIKNIYKKYDNPYKVYQEMEIISNYSLEEVKKALISNLNLEQIVIEDDKICAVTKKNFSLSYNSWGENIEIKLINEFNNKFEYFISSKSKFSFTFNDLGNNLLVIDRIDKLIGSE